MTDDSLVKDELTKLRVGVARIAQAAGVSLRHLGLPDDAPYEVLHNAARFEERGWNRLAGMVAARVEELQRNIDGG